MAEQLIIAVSREFGSGGHIIAKHLADEFNLPLYDANLLRSIAAERDVEHAKLAKYDEIPKKFSRTIRGHSSSPEENIAWIQFDYILNKAKEGESFVIVGRCAETVLKDFDCMIPIFVIADMDFKINRVMHTDNLDSAQAEKLIIRNDKRRRDYHNYYCTNKWGDSTNYELCIDTGKLGIEKTTEIVSQYIHERQKVMK